MTRVLLLSAYRSDSHAAWVDWLVNRIDGVEWTVRELPGRHFAWRIRGNPLSWLDEMPDDPPDLILATSMVDLATLKGVHPHLANVPSTYYFHENQFAYPVSRNQVKTIEHAIVQIYGALAADELLFNSDYNRRTFLDGTRQFAKKMPDRAPRDLPERLAPKSRVLPVPIEPVPPAENRDRRLIMWNHRWEYDKQPDLFAEAVSRLAEAGQDFRLALLGGRGQQPVPALERLRRELPDRIVVDGFVSRDEYRSILGRTGVVVSTAAHEFQGLSILEAVSAGAVPVVPDALCYPEQYSRPYRYKPRDVESLTKMLAASLRGRGIHSPEVAAWYTESLEARWASVLLCSRGKPSPTPNGPCD